MFCNWGKGSVVIGVKMFWNWGKGNVCNWGKRNVVIGVKMFVIGVRGVWVIGGSGIRVREFLKEMKLK